MAVARPGDPIGTGPAVQAPDDGVTPGARGRAALAPPVTPGGGATKAASGTDWVQVARGLRYTHFRANANTNQLIRVISTVQAATAMLEEKGVLDHQALEVKTTEAAQSVARDFAAQGLGVQLDQSKTSKYEAGAGVQIDCENRLSLCQAACCKLQFALSGEDLEEGTIKWNLGRPYVIAQAEDGWCVHLDRRRQCCGTYQSRPLTCRTYDCRGDSRIWLDFDNRVVNPLIHSQGWPEQARASAATDGAPPPRSDSRPQVQRAHDSVLDVLADRPVVWAWRGWFVSAYGAFLGIAFAVAAAVWVARVGAAANLGWGPLFLPGLVLASFIGSRLLRLTESGLDRLITRDDRGGSGHTLYGGLVAGISLALWSWIGRADAWWLADHAVPAVALGLAIGKLGCLASGCCVGRPTTHRPSIRYAHPLSKAVAYHGLAGMPLIPVQLYESVFALAIAAGLLLLPAQSFGEGRVLGFFLVILSVGRTLLLSFRYRAPEARADTLLAGLVHLALVGTGTWLMLAERGAALTATPEVGAHAGALAPSIVAAAILAVVLFGIHRRPAVSDLASGKEKAS